MVRPKAQKLEVTVEYWRNKPTPPFRAGLTRFNTLTTIGLSHRNLAAPFLVGDVGVNQLDYRGVLLAGAGLGSLVDDLLVFVPEVFAPGSPAVVEFEEVVVITDGTTDFDGFEANTAHDGFIATDLFEEVILIVSVGEELPIPLESEFAALAVGLALGLTGLAEVVAFAVDDLALSSVLTPSEFEFRCHDSRWGQW